jgi:hypothetical protein
VPSAISRSPYIPSPQQPRPLTVARSSPQQSTGFSGASSFESAARDGLIKIVANGIEEWVSPDDLSPRPSWAQQPRAPHGEGMFKDKKADDIVKLGWDKIKTASPRELYSLRGEQLRGFDKALEDGTDGPGMAKRFNTLKKGQRRAVLRAKIFAGIFDDFKKMIAKHSSNKW